MAQEVVELINKSNRYDDAEDAINNNFTELYAGLGAGVPTSRTITINGVTQDLSANRSWTVSGGASDFTDLGDVPSSYAGNALKLVRVNAAPNALEFVTADKNLVGLGNVDNTSDSAKPVSTAQQATIDKAVAPFFVQFDSSTLTASTVQYFGQQPNAITSTAGTRKIYFRRACVIEAAELYIFSGTAGSNTSWSIYIRVDNTTDYLIATVGANTQERIFSNNSLNSGSFISIAANSYIEIKSDNPAWGVAPSGCRGSGYLLVRFT